MPLLHIMVGPVVLVLGLHYWPVANFAQHSRCLECRYRVKECCCLAAAEKA